jgi:mannose/fructose/N-acetylgalactosamine-specific phosphotransferase system component IIB
MGVLLYRVDDRLIHGQVVVGWGRFLKINSILVCSERVADDEFAERAAIVLFETPADALYLLNMNVKIEKLNIGGMHFQAGKRQIMESVSVGEEDCRALLELAARNVDVYFQMVPQARPVEIIPKLPCDL